jgi:hypothetical protein
MVINAIKLAIKSPLWLALVVQNIVADNGATPRSIYIHKPTFYSLIKYV